ncbi:hypothetical protein LSH36_233g03040 [Paralvinella palmiformis]|uniref:Uncharacterized protein n=1 Tax=Paralvinella palmiformis TaxID=53620 RepID=A0AAD9N5F9_9ANNE|nr:hypothetical protein LSH36_233g03040 [Paralvinella palmiformis]
MAELPANQFVFLLSITRGKSRALSVCVCGRGSTTSGGMSFGSTQNAHLKDDGYH